MTSRRAGSATGSIRNMADDATALHQHAAAYDCHSDEIVLLHGRFFEKAPHPASYCASPDTTLHAATDSSPSG